MELERYKNLTKEGFKTVDKCIEDLQKMIDAAVTYASTIDARLRKVEKHLGLWEE